jgi:hypothetical protein
MDHAENEESTLTKEELEGTIPPGVHDSIYVCA